MALGSPEIPRLSLLFLFIVPDDDPATLGEPPAAGPGGGRSPLVFRTAGRQVKPPSKDTMTPLCTHVSCFLSFFLYVFMLQNKIVAGQRTEQHATKLNIRKIMNSTTTCACTLLTYYGQDSPLQPFLTVVLWRSATCCRDRSCSFCLSICGAPKLLGGVNPSCNPTLSLFACSVLCSRSCAVLLSQLCLCDCVIGWTTS